MRSPTLTFALLCSSPHEKVWSAATDARPGIVLRAGLAMPCAELAHRAAVVLRTRYAKPDTDLCAAALVATREGVEPRGEHAA